MTRSVGRHCNPDAVGFMSQRSWILRVPLLLAIFGILIQLTLPLVHIWHIEYEHLNRALDMRAVWQVNGLQLGSHTTFLTAAPPQESSQHRPASCHVCATFVQAQPAFYAQFSAISVMSNPLGLIVGATSPPYIVLPHCPDSRAPPLLDSSV